MIDIENEVYTLVSTAVKAVCDTAYTCSVYTDAPPSFPCVMVEMIGNSTLAWTRDTDHAENHARISFEINVYTTGNGGKKAQAKTLMQAADAVMLGKGFVRTMLSPTPNYADASIYRMTARYEGIVGSDNFIYQE